MIRAGAEYDHLLGEPGTPERAENVLALQQVRIEGEGSVEAPTPDLAEVQQAMASVYDDGGTMDPVLWNALCDYVRLRKS